MRLIDADTAAAFAENCGATFVAKRLRDSNAFPEVVTRCKDCRYRGLICCPTMHETMGSGLLDCAVDNGYCWCGKPKEGTHVDDHD